jgi:competence protein ComEC
MPSPTAYSWARVPFVRLLAPLVGGIVAQWYFECSYRLVAVVAIVSLLSLVAFSLLRAKDKYRCGYTSGICVNLLIASIGAGLVWFHDVRNEKDWIGIVSRENSAVVVTLQEPLVEKTNSFKALAGVEGVYRKPKYESCEGNIIIYFKKDSSVKRLNYGTEIIFNKALQEIKNTGNPGAFNYQRYSLFQSVTHQVYLSEDNYVVLPTEHKDRFRQFILDCRNWVVGTLQAFIRSEKEQGLAEALLIGYKDDLDKSLVQSYTNTGVVHIIAISGMHLALIYGLLLLITSPLGKGRLRWLRTILILLGLWLFTLLAGAQASVVRSAVMFTCIVIGEVLSRKASIYNTLALSAFVLLVYNPFWLWDVGFQLSYAAVLSIVAFYSPVYHWVYFPNKSLDFMWRTVAISIAAQILTTPISLYHFHQFPVLFLFTNIVAVPLSSVVLFGEIFICVFSWYTPIARILGSLTETMIYWMNSYLEIIERVSFSLWKGFSISVPQTFLLLVFVTTACVWFNRKAKWLLWTALGSLLLFVSLRSASFIQAYGQRKLIVYNVSKLSAIELINGREYNYIGDSALLSDEYLVNFHVRPSRVVHRVSQRQTLPVCCKDLEFCNKRIAIIDSSTIFTPLETKLRIDVLIVSKNPKLYVSDLVRSFSIGHIVVCASVPVWKARLWKRDCDSLGIHCFDVREKGAFVMNL